MVGLEVGNYRILEKLGEGGMGVVYKAVDVNLDRTVAVKALNIEFSGNPELAQRFLAEIKAAGKLSHPNVPTLYTLLIENGRPWMVMEFVEGETLEQMVRRRGPIPSEEAIALFRQMLLGIGCAHRLGIVHRDIKPSNIMLNRQGIIKVMDVGVAQALSARGAPATGTRVGTTFYMSPEQFLNSGVDSRSDIYSLGVTLYEMLTAKFPIDADNDYQILADHVNTPHFFPYVPKGVKNAILTAVRKNPDARFHTVEEFGAALEDPQGFTAAEADITNARPAAIVSSAPAHYSGLAANRAGAWAAVGPRFFHAKGRKILGAGIVAILVLAGILLGPLLKARRPALSLNVNFAGSNTTLMASSEVAGVVPESNWNNASGASSSSALSLVNDQGLATSASITWTSDNVWNTAIADLAGNNRMMRGYLDNGNGNPTTVTFFNLVRGTYNIYVYTDGGNSGSTRTGTYQIHGIGITTTSISATNVPNSNFAGTFVQADNSNGNYVLFSGVSLSSGFSLTAIPGATTDVPRAPVNGIQIIPATPNSVAALPTPALPTPSSVAMSMINSATLLSGPTLRFTLHAPGLSNTVN